ncbi:MULTISPECIES: phosphotriesterase family protein [Geobacillus]|uniref:Phosphotriesterase family protein n=1 Tax=Geobacillus proteiniphilus TaxID=860353 RepID=A0A1Q5T5M4_9BACL|nr:MULTISPECIES: phosphotriesterase [Geobacillus]ADU94467.1 aryldialkylphosphatase [Geobacillus sp. Y412MC52]AMV11241.1 phosphotriesterase [Geobacillus thermoleovorans]AOL34862.1 phosphotriesterase [Geobacillus thermoleovorans]OKO95498.1 phosphotriesterase family protein [Geobacillus proteiniphilus]TRY42499.1 phosphotriesterase [Geobacillus sp. LEMMJ02]
MSFIRTLHGDIDPEQLGFTYSHEHIVCRPPYWKEKGEDDLLLDDKEKSLKDVLDFVKHGGNAIVDATAVDYGRDVEAVADIARKAKIHIIGTAGFNKSFLWGAKLEEKIQKIVGPYTTYYEWIETATVNELAEFVIQEVEAGLEGTSYKGGQIKFGTGYNRITPLEEKTIRAVARAHHETKAPIHSHTEAGTMALEQIEILRSEGVDLSNVSFGHMDRNPDPYYHEQIAKTGAYLCFDGIGKIKYAPESTRIHCILELVRKGYEKQILVSGDTARKSYYKHYDYGLGLEYIISKWVPRFIDEANRAGFDGEKLIYLFFVENPSRCLTFKK